MRVWVGAFLCTTAFGCGRSGVPIGGSNLGNPDIPLPEGFPGTPGAPVPIIDGGRGLDGPIVFGEGLTEFDDCEVVTSAAGTELGLAGAFAPFGDGRRIVVAQMNDQLVGTGSGETEPVLDFKRAGQWEIAEITTRNGNDVALLAPLKGSYESNLGEGLRAQACLVHEWTSVTLNAGAIVSPREWNGLTGGILAAQVQGTLFLDYGARLSADASGFRGGYCGAPSDVEDVSGYEVLEGLGGGKGEGLDARFFEKFGRGAAANAGGGGNGLNAGGGGGGGAGAGGTGGRQRGSTTNPVFGDDGTHGIAGGAAVDSERLLFGGGGGAGHLDTPVGAIVCGGAGGGALVLRAKQIAGAGWISAEGGDGRQVQRNGGGGGGAGGTVDIETADASVFAGFITANGGEGGDVTAGIFTTTTYGPGGGGGGGSVRAKGVVPSPYTVFAIGGDSGTNEANGTLVGADEGEAGSVTY